MRNVKLTNKLKLGIGIILCITFSAISIFLYYFVKRQYLEETYKKTEIVLSYIDATMDYVRTELRPRMFHVLPKDEFIREAMSTTFVTKGITERFVKLFPEYVYRRVAIDPRNPENMANELERQFISNLSKNPEGVKQWKGLVTRNGKRYFVRQRPVLMEAQCLLCHGNPSQAPKSLLKIYGENHGFYRKIGDVVGVESVAIPVDKTFYAINRLAILILILGLLGTAATFFIINYFHAVVLVRPLRKAGTLFKSVVSGEKGLDIKLDVRGNDEISEVVGSFNQMISHLKRSQDELISSEQKYRRIFEGSKDAIILVDCAGPIQDVNHSGLELWGYATKEDFIKHVSLQNFFLRDETLNDFVFRIQENEFVKDYEAILGKRDGTPMNALITATLRRDADNHICGYECIVKDMTERKRMEERIREADKLASIGQLAAGVAHEINNPLSVIIGYAGLLIKGRSPESGMKANLKEDLQTIHNNAQTCKKIVEDLLNFSRQKKPQYTEADVNHTLESVVSVVENQFGRHSITIKRNFAPSIPRVAMDIDKMRQVYMNLLINAMQAMDFGGEIHVSTRCDETSEGVLIFFSDTGCGIPGAIQARIFEPFFTTKERGTGTGLGLAVSYGIVKEHKGDITFESEEGKGATFRVWLPLNGKG